MLVKADEYTEKYMEDNGTQFPEASIENLVEKIKRGAKGKNLQEYAIHLMKTLDKGNSGAVSLEEFAAGLKDLEIFCSKHEEHALLRRFDTNNEGKVNMEEFYNCLAAMF